MQITETTVGEWTILALDGKIDQAGAEILKAALLPRMTGGSVALDFTGVEYVTSVGFRVLMQAEREQRAKQGRLMLGNMSEMVRRFFDIAGLSPVFKITHDVRTAVAAAGDGHR